MSTSAYMPGVNTHGAAAILLWLLLGGSVMALGWTAYQDIGHHQTAHTSNDTLTNKGEKTSPHPGSSQAKSSPSKASTQVDLSKASLFGTANQVAAAITQKHIPDTRLRLELKGAFSSSDTSRASALIAEKGKNAKRYHINESLPGGALLTQVNADHVTLSRGGRLEILRFPKPVSAASSNPRLASNGMGNGTSAPTRSGMRNNQHNNSTNNNASARTESIKERLMRLRQNKN